MTLNKSSKKISHNYPTVITKQNTLKPDGLNNFFASSILKNFICGTYSYTTSVKQYEFQQKPFNSIWIRINTGNIN